MKLFRSERSFHPRPLSALALAGGLGALTIVACTSSSGDGGFFFPQDTAFGTTGGSDFVIVERLLAFLADETTTGGPGGSVLNNDTLVDGDQVAIVVDTLSSTMNETNLRVAARSIHVIGREVYIVADEAADAFDWDMDLSMDDFVLLHWSELAGVTTALDTIAVDSPGATADDGAPDVVLSGTRLYYRSTTAGALMGETSLSFVDGAAPTTVTRVFDADDMNLDPIPFAVDDGLLFCVLDETAEGADLNGDGDTGMDIVPAAHDERVVALLDTTDPAAMLRSTGLAILPGLSLDDVPLRARPLALGDWIVAFLVSEIAHNDLMMAGGFNDPLNHNASFQPVHCAGPDADLTDEVLHWLRFAAWDADPVMDPPMNTGLSGIAQVSMGGRVVATAGSPPNVGTIEREAGQNCDLNNDMDGMLDTVFRWVETGSDPMMITYLTHELDLVAVDTTTAGGTNGVAEIGNSFVAVIDEAADMRDYNSDGPNNFDVLGLFTPATAGAGGGTTQWLTDQDSSAGDEDFIICDWLMETANRTSLNSSFGERGSMLINPGTGNEDLNEDGDLNDFIPVIVTLGVDLNFAGPLCAVSPANAGIVQANGLTFFRASEAQESRDLNGDMDMTDFVLMRTTLSSGFTAPIATVTNAMRPVIAVDANPFNQITGVFEANELLDGIDHNGDNGGVPDDTAVARYFRM